MSRLVLISNKQCDSKDLACATQALSAVEASDNEQGLWLGWNGDVQNFGAAPLRPVSHQHRSGYQQVTFPLSTEEFHFHYQGYYHDGLWPVFHNHPEKAHFTPENYRAYRQLNQHFADIACEYVCPNDIICIDDYQLLPCGQALKEQGLLNPCAFFFHLPFPSAALLRQIPEHHGLIGSLFFYDLIGFQSLDDRNNFLNYLASEYPVEILPDDQLQVNGHIFATGIFPAGINARKIY
ncbi:Alpha,alpha-trehalose-phosphate synthase [UDP-forming] [Serratia proteamaculans]|uniref:trehalose-6-phosphate synthase n=1 Tax=Serratia proteamaculans TaxID=28151 RepID=UPI00124A2366|nr:trehalose-6-phosphate synthase [Serratia proteamaculans]KAB1495873.1 glycosyl transferase [Serratia proteamaculans]CAI1005864.1 Alpha,alpha-trehalose-phosphate synthase [UDP-forming] [Serratia proteamaculans]CAI1066778.1 Alpha,alpha-trehalose-phosphate synthase [UDP-forming] [Serratia proteamaculans]